MDKKIKSIIDHSLFITISCLDIYCKWLDIISKLKFDELSHRSDKERYLISAFFSYCLIEPVLKTLNNSDEFSRALEGLIQKFHEDIINKKDIKKKLFNSIDMDAIDSLETCVWLSNTQLDESTKIILITADHVNYLAAQKIFTVDENNENKKVVSMGSKLKIGQPIFNCLNNIFSDHSIRISNFNASIKDNLGK